MIRSNTNKQIPSKARSSKGLIRNTDNYDTEANIVGQDKKLCITDVQSSSISQWGNCVHTRCMISCINYHWSALLREMIW